MVRTDFHRKYKVTKFLGSGSFAKVYKIQNLKNGKEFAVKGFNKEFVEFQNRGKESLSNEVSILQKLNHKNILKLHEVHESKNSIYLTTDLYYGGDLSVLLKNSEDCTLEESESIKILMGILQGLVYLDENNYAHRDIKPDNIIIANKGEINPDDVILADFGLMTKTDAKELIYKRCGTPGYVAPEIIVSDTDRPDFSITTKCDVFSTGVLFYVMLVGEPPFKGDDYKEIMKSTTECKVDYNIPKLKTRSPELIALMKGMLRVNPHKRISAREALASPLFDDYRPSGYETTKSIPIDDQGSDGDESPDKAPSINSIPSIEMRNGGNYNGERRANNSIMSIFIGSKDSLDSGGSNSTRSKAKKTDKQDLYKQSLLSRAQEDLKNDMVMQESLASFSQKSKPSDNSSDNDNQ